MCLPCPAQVLNDSAQYWVFMTDYFTLDEGGNFTRDSSKLFTSSGLY
jgi:hypothetical protein